MNFPDNLRYTKDHEWIRLEGNTAYIGGSDGSVYVASLAKAARNIRPMNLAKLMQSKRPILAIALSPSERFVAVAQFSAVIIIDLQTKQIAHTMTQVGGRILSLAWDPREELLLLGRASGETFGWRLAGSSAAGRDSLNALEQYGNAGGSPIVRLAFHPSGRAFVSAEQDGRISLWRLLRTEKELGLSCSIILKNIQPEHEPLIMNALKNLNTTSSLHLLRLVFQFPDHEITQKFKSEFDQKFHTNKIETIEVPTFKKSKKTFAFNKILGIIPPLWYRTSTRKSEVYNQLIKYGWITEFIDSLSRYQDEQSALDFGKFLIDQKLFTELIPVEKISELLNYDTFNQLALYWIKSNKGDIDLEAFLKFIRVEKHFWSDDLLLGILSFSEYKRLVKEYNLEVFFEKIPYKINPNSKQLGKIHKQIQFSEDPHFDFNQIIKFRQDLRK